jgi:hypothetical protein
VIQLVSEAKGRLFKNTQSHYFIYLPLTLAEDSMFPISLKEELSVPVKISFDNAKKQLIVKKWTADSKQNTKKIF